MSVRYYSLKTQNLEIQEHSDLEGIFYRMDFFSPQFSRAALLPSLISARFFPLLITTLSISSKIHNAENSNQDGHCNCLLQNPQCNVYKIVNFLHVPTILAQEKISAEA